MNGAFQAGGIFVRDRDHAWALCAYALAALAVGRGIQVGLDVTALHMALFCISAAMAACVAALFVERWPAESGARALQFLLVAGVAAEVFVHARGVPHQLAVLEHFASLKIAAVVALFVLCVSAWGPVKLRGVAFIAVLGLWMFSAFVTVRNTTPKIDVVPVHQEAINALLHGQDPFAIKLPIVYGAADVGRYYQPGDIVDGRLQFGYPYPPLSLLLAVPGHVLAGDYRYGNIVAVAIAACLMAFARPGAVAKLATALFLFTPLGFFVLAMGWTEALAVLLLAVTVFAAVRRPALTPYCFGLFFSVKQYFVLAAVAALAIIRPFRIRTVLSFWAKAAVTAGVIVLPFALWNVRAFIHTFTRGFPVREEAISFNSVLLQRGIHASSFLMLLPALAVGVLLWFKVPLTPSGFAAAIGTFYLFLFAFAKIAFTNYYYFVIAALCAAIAVAGAEQTQGSPSLAKAAKREPAPAHT